MGASAWDREPRSNARLYAGVVFPPRGVIDPSFLLRGKLVTNRTNRKQAPHFAILGNPFYGNARMLLFLQRKYRASQGLPLSHK